MGALYPYLNDSCEYPNFNYFSEDCSVQVAGNNNSLCDCDGNCTADVDCFGNCNGYAVVDCSGTCGGYAYTDCNGECCEEGGCSFTNPCGQCICGYNAGLDNCIEDDTWDGSTVGGCVEDVNGNYCIDVELDECFVCNGQGLNEYDCCGEDIPSGCDEICGSTLEFDGCDVCGGNNSTCADCAGVPNGDASIDDCDICVGGTTGFTPNFLKDECGVCNGDGYTNTCIGTDDCENMDCAGECFGDAVEDCDGICNGNGCFNQDCDAYPLYLFDCEGNCLDEYNISCPCGEFEYECECWDDSGIYETYPICSGEVCPCQ